MRPGWQTTEFWVTVLPIVGAFLLLALGRVDAEQLARLWPVFVGTGAYAGSRALVKRQPTALTISDCKVGP